MPGTWDELQSSISFMSGGRKFLPIFNDVGGMMSNGIPQILMTSNGIPQIPMV